MNSLKEKPAAKKKAASPQVSPKLSSAGPQPTISLKEKPAVKSLKEEPAVKKKAAPPQVSPKPSPARPQPRIQPSSPTGPSPDRSLSMPPGTASAPPPAPEPTPPPACRDQPAPAPQPPVQPTASQQATILWNVVVPSLMTRAIGIEKYVQAPGCRVLLDRLVENAGNPGDAIEVMLIEQLTMAHYRAAELQAKAGEATSFEAIKIYNTAAARMSAEVRKTALALQTYREKALALASAESKISQSGAVSSHTGAGEPVQGSRRGGRREKTRPQAGK